MGALPGEAAKPIGLGLAVSLRVAGTHLETTDDVGRNFGAALGRANGCRRSRSRDHTTFSVFAGHYTARRFAMDQEVLTAKDLTAEQAPILLFKPTARARETAARGRRLRLRTVLQTAGAIAVLAVAGFYGNYYWTTGRFMIYND
jgi:hypothetical protein